MLNKQSYDLGVEGSRIRDLHDYGCQRAAQVGWENIFECRISKINGEAHYENQIRLTIKVKRNSKQ